MVSHPLAFKRIHVIFLAVFLSLAFLSGSLRATREDQIEILLGVRAALEKGRHILLIYSPKQGEGYLSMAEKFTPSRETWKELKEINSDPILIEGKEYKIPYRLLRDEYKYLLISKIFSSDRYEKNAWHHYPSKSSLETFSVGLWQTAEWFTGKGEHFKELMSINAVSDPASISGKEILIPKNLLLPVFSRTPTSDFKDITFGADKKGEYAGYRLKRGEALYTSVVIRFTGVTEIDDVNHLADLIAKRSGIRNVKKIPVGQLVKIPIDDLLPEYLPRTDPRRIAHELERYELEKYKKTIVAKKLEGVYLILDAGHGGVDLGTLSNGVWEHDYVYDIMCRIKRKIEKETGATVLPIIKDQKTGFTIYDKKKLPKNKQGHILTHPNFLAKNKKDTKRAVNLRWYLANSLSRKLVAKGVDEDRIVFVSVHADSLYPGLRGAMVYIPGQRYIRGKYGNGGSKLYTRFREVREKPYVSIPKKRKAQSEALSREFAKKVIKAFAKEGLPVHEYIPIRNRITRKGRKWVPAILRGNEIPIKILLEVANLKNKKDAQLMKKPEFREEVASAFVKALLGFYGE
jgi:N-acetylmuramoyl-L-alanine amidase